MKVVYPNKNKSTEIKPNLLKSLINPTDIKFFLSQMLKAKIFFIITCTSFAFSVLWLQLVSKEGSTAAKKTLIEEAIVNVARDPRYSAIYRKVEKLPKGLKYMLLWADSNLAPFYFFGKGQEVFIKNNCSQINCYVTWKKNFFKDITRFDAIAFNGRTMRARDLPKKRSPRQKYIYFNMESADNFPVCDPVFDNFFNWTATYKLKSDIPFGYLLVRKKDGSIIGPSINMNWPLKYPNVNKKFAKKLTTKSKVAAWFVSHCDVRSKRNQVVAKLQRALAAYGHKIDVYGSCGPLHCPRGNKSQCDKMLERDYFFYMALENSMDEDYATEKLLTALQHHVVPIVYGGSDYTRFLPPGSYLDARVKSASSLAAIMDRLMNSPKYYQKYFSWKELYTYSDPSRRENVCKVCAALNDVDMFSENSEYERFRDWWLPNYKYRCKL